MKIKRYLLIIQYGAGHVHVKASSEDRAKLEAMMTPYLDARKPNQSGKYVGAAPKAYICEVITSKDVAKTPGFSRRPKPEAP